MKKQHKKQPHIDRNTNFTQQWTVSRIWHSLGIKCQNLQPWFRLPSKGVVWSLVVGVSHFASTKDRDYLIAGHRSKKQQRFRQGNTAPLLRSEGLCEMEPTSVIQQNNWPLKDEPKTRASQLPNLASQKQNLAAFPPPLPFFQTEGIPKKYRSGGWRTPMDPASAVPQTAETGRRPAESTAWLGETERRSDPIGDRSPFGATTNGLCKLIPC